MGERRRKAPASCPVGTTVPPGGRGATAYFYFCFFRLFYFCVWAGVACVLVVCAKCPITHVTFGLVLTYHMRRDA